MSGPAPAMQLYVVGGAVRDELLGRPAADRQGRPAEEPRRLQDKFGGEGRAAELAEARARDALALAARADDRLRGRAAGRDVDDGRGATFRAGVLAGAFAAALAGAGSAGADLPVALAATRASTLRAARAGVDFSALAGAVFAAVEPLASLAVAARLAGFTVAWLALVAATYTLSVLRGFAERRRAPSESISY